MLISEGGEEKLYLNLHQHVLKSTLFVQQSVKCKKESPHLTETRSLHMAVAMCECPLEEEEEEFEDCEELFYCCNCDTLMSNQIGTTDSPWRGTSNLTRS